MTKPALTLKQLQTVKHGDTLDQSDCNALNEMANNDVDRFAIAACWAIQYHRERHVEAMQARAFHRDAYGY